jgi:predicted nuclease of restriction endonuclease-like RecB superfamily
MRTPGWRFDATIRAPDGTVARFGARGVPRAKRGEPPVGASPRRARYDSAWERSLAADFRKRFGRDDRDGWTLSRETNPITHGDELFLPDFTVRHADGREALIELVGFWTIEYLEAKARKVAEAGLHNLILVVYRGLAVGRTEAALERLTASVGADRVVWFVNKPRAAEIVRAVERCAVKPRTGSENPTTRRTSR